MLSCDLLHDMRTYTALTLPQCYDSVHRLDLERELDDHDPPCKVDRVTFGDTYFALADRDKCQGKVIGGSYKYVHICVSLYKYMYVCMYVCMYGYMYACILYVER